MADENSDRDLFGDPVTERVQGRGRPEHNWTLENSNKVLLMFAARASVKQAATAIGLSVPTFRKHYFSEVAQRDAAELRLEATQLGRLNGLAASGNVSAEKELAKRLDKIRVARISEQMVARQSKAAKPEKLGKKAKADRAAKELGGRFRTRRPPSLAFPAGNA